MIEEKIREIHTAVEQLQLQRRDLENVQETFVALKSGHSAFKSIDLTLIDNRGEGQPSADPDYEEMRRLLQDLNGENSRLKAQNEKLERDNEILTQRDSAGINSQLVGMLQKNEELERDNEILRQEVSAGIKSQLIELQKTNEELVKKNSSLSEQLEIARGAIAGYQEEICRLVFFPQPTQ